MCILPAEFLENEEKADKPASRSTWSDPGHLSLSIFFFFEIVFLLAFLYQPNSFWLLHSIP